MKKILTLLLCAVLFTTNFTTAEAAKKQRSSFETTSIASTAAVNNILASNIRLNGKKITCFGDSITAGLDSSTGQFATTTYPQFLQQITGATVVNYGIGGSTIGSYFYEPMCIRYKNIPKDSDYIVVMGSTNDSFYILPQWFGDFKNRTPGTFVGDLNILFSGLKTEYPNAKIIICSPPKQKMHSDLVNNGFPHLTKQSKFTNALKKMSAEYGFKYIDFYGNNILNSYDAAVLAAYCPDGCHPNVLGYNIMANIIASEIVNMEK